MRLFRRSVDLSTATIREANRADHAAIVRLFQYAPRRFQSFTMHELPGLLEHASAVIVPGPDGPVGALLTGPPIARVTWLRGAAFGEGLEPARGLAGMAPTLCAIARAHGITALYYAGDEASDTWLIPLLVRQGFVHDTDVLAFEKLGYDIPAPGASDVSLTVAHATDLADILAIDQVCFPPPWMKGPEILSPALAEASYVRLARRDGQALGYSLATTHYYGRLIHLVRLAVRPEVQQQGIGTCMLADLVAFARDRGASAITLNTQTDNLRAQHLYRRFGFVQTSERQPVLRIDLG